MMGALYAVRSIWPAGYLEVTPSWISYSVNPAVILTKKKKKKINMVRNWSCLRLGFGFFLSVMTQLLWLIILAWNRLWLCFRLGKMSFREKSLAGWDGKQGQPCFIEGKRCINFWQHFRQDYFFYLGFFPFYKVHSALSPLLSRHAYWNLPI